MSINPRKKKQRLTSSASLIRLKSAYLSKLFLYRRNIRLLKMPLTPTRSYAEIAATQSPKPRVGFANEMTEIDDFPQLPGKIAIIAIP